MKVYIAWGAPKWHWMIGAFVNKADAEQACQEEGQPVRVVEEQVCGSLDEWREERERIIKARMDRGEVP